MYGGTVSSDRINVKFPPRVKAAIESAAADRAESASNWLRRLAIERLIADGKITAADVRDDAKEPQ
jgi:hypothetical protein